MEVFDVVLGGASLDSRDAPQRTTSQVASGSGATSLLGDGGSRFFKCFYENKCNSESRPARRCEVGSLPPTASDLSESESEGAKRVVANNFLTNESECPQCDGPESPPGPGIQQFFFST